MPILRSPIRRRDTTLRAWRSRLVWASRWERCGAADGATTPDGAAITTSTSITTIISSTTATASMAATDVNSGNPGQQQLATQPAAPRRSALWRQRHRQQVRRHRAWRLHAESAERMPGRTRRASSRVPALATRRTVEPAQRRYARRRQPWRKRGQHEREPRHRTRPRRQPASS